MVPNGWNISSIDSISDSVNVGFVGSCQKDYRDSGIPLIRTTNLKNGKLDLENIIYVTSEFHIKNKKSQLKEYDLLIARHGNHGSACMVPKGFQDANCLNIVIVRPDLTKVVPEFMLDLFNYSLSKKLSSKAAGSTQTVVNTKEIASQVATVPPLPEQRKIAKILSTWDNAISTTERLIDNSKQQKKALMQQLLTGKKRLLDDSGKPFEGDWETAMLSDIGKVSIGLVTTMTKYYVDDGIPLIRNSDIKPNTVNKTKMLQLCSDFSSDYDNRKLRKGDIVTVHTGEVGVSSVIDDELDGCIGFATLNTRPNTSKVNSQYLSWYFNSERFINWCVSMSTGDGRQNLNLKDFVKAKVLLPSLEEQQKIVSVLKNADKEIDVLVQQLADLKQEKKALMQQLLTGKRRVKVDKTDAV